MRLTAASKDSFRLASVIVAFCPGFRNLVLALEDVGQDPDPAEVGDPEELLPLDELQPGKDVAVDDDPRRRRDHVDLLSPLAGPGDLLDLPFAHAEVAQGVAVLGDTDLGGIDLGRLGVSSLLHPVEGVEPV